LVKAVTTGQSWLRTSDSRICLERLCLKDRADAIVHVATIGDGHDETVTRNSERVGRRINHADIKKKTKTKPDAGTGTQRLKTKLI